jgi:hypothetical protein
MILRLLAINPTNFKIPSCVLISSFADVPFWQSRWHDTHTHTLWLQWKASSRHRPSLLVEGKRETTNRVLMFYKKKMRHRLRQKSLEDVNMLFDFVPFAIKQIIVSLSHSQVIKILIYIRGINSYLNYKRSGMKI